jgi:hypothetical protein
MLVVSHNAGGSTSPSGTSYHNGFSTVAVTATPLAGFEIATITVNGVMITISNAAGMTFNVLMNANRVDVLVTFRAIPAPPPPPPAPANNFIRFLLASRLIGDRNDRATQWLDINRVPTGFASQAITGRQVYSNGSLVSGFTLPYPYATDEVLHSYVTFNPAGVTVEDKFVAFGNDYFRLGIMDVQLNANNDIVVTVRLNNRLNKPAADIAMCQLRVTEPITFQTSEYDVPIINGINDYTFVVPNVGVGQYSIFTETRLVAGDKQTSYSVSFARIG